VEQETDSGDPEAMQAAFVALATKVAKTKRSCNALDVQIEIALFEPDEESASIRANAAGTKVIVTSPAGKDTTYRARDWTMDRAVTLAVLRSRAQSKEQAS